MTPYITSEDLVVHPTPTGSLEGAPKVPRYQSQEAVKDPISLSTNSSEPRSQAPLAPEPIAICGIAIRLPGNIRSTSDFWNLLVNGEDARGDMTPARVLSPGLHSLDSPPNGYYLNENLSEFDPSLFKLSRAELEQADPRQRQLLEITRECLENAGEANFRGRSVGCYVGTFGDDWSQLLSKDEQIPGGLDFRGTIDAILANRISYEFDFKGPSMVIKTGCSSSMTSLHLACQALHFGDCDAAIVAGCNLILGTTLTESLTMQGVVSPDGSSKVFDSSANGYARAEAINCIYIKRLTSAVRDGNPIRAVIRGTGTNNDGESHGMTTPNGSAHEALMKRVYDTCGLNPHDTAFVECHGTGTPVGDPIETTAVANVFGEHGITIGSVKANVGHSEGASGLTSLIKAVLMLEKVTVPPQIKVKELNPRIQMLEKRLHIPREAKTLPNDRFKRISVNSYGIGGSNAHVIVERWTSGQITPTKIPNARQRLLLFSAGTQAALQKSISSIQEYQAKHPGRLEDLSYTLACGREKLALRAFAIVEPGARAFSTSIVLKRPSARLPIVMVFSGQSAQWHGMARELIVANSEFRRDLQAMDEVLQSLSNAPHWRIEDALQQSAETIAIHRSEYSQPLCTAVQIALVNIYTRIGVRPDAVIGHSSGEIAAAYACGGISMRDAIIIAYYRGIASSESSSTGTMTVIGLEAKATSRYIEGSTVALACDNGPTSVTISGNVQEVERVMKAIQQQQPETFMRRLNISVAYHSPSMQTVAGRYLQLMQSTMATCGETKTLRAPMFSTTTNVRIDSTAPLSLDYWCTNLCSPVQFHSATVEILRQFPSAIFLEVGPHSTLSGPIKQICVKRGLSNPYVPTLLRNTSSMSTLLSAIGQMFQLDIPMEYFQAHPDQKTLQDLPPYAWDRASFCVQIRLLNDRRLAYRTRHPLLGERVVETSLLEPSWRSVLVVGNNPWIMDHQFQGDIVFPLAGYIHLATAACQESSYGNEQGFALRHIVAHTPMVIPSPTVEIVTTLRRVPQSDHVLTDWWEFRVSSYSKTTWVQHCHGQVKRVPTVPIQYNANRGEQRWSAPSGGGKAHARAGSQRAENGGEVPYLEATLPSSRWYSHMEQIGIRWGPEFQRLSKISFSRHESKASATIRSEGLQSMTHGMHPCIVDQALQLVFLASTKGLSRPHQLSIPTMVEEIYLSTNSGDLNASAWVSDRSNKNEVSCLENGRLILKVCNMHLATVSTGNDSSDCDYYAAASLRWYPDVDHAPQAQLFRPVRSATEFDVMQEEMVILCMIDNWHALQNGSPAATYLNSYWRWLNEQISNICSRNTPIMRSYHPFLEYSKEQRIFQIDRRFSVLEKNPYEAAVALTVKRTHENAVDLFSGRVDILDLLTSDGILPDFYSATSFDCGPYVASIARKQPTLRILEVGAGTGGTTDLILRSLSVSTLEDVQMYTSYTFTDVSAGFFVKAKERFKDWSDLDYRILDISRDPLSQGFEAASFDLIIAANVIHATPNLGSTLKNLNTLLSAGGSLVFSELCTTSRIPGYVFGWFPGWWLGADNDRKDEPFVSLDRWIQELEHAGFAFERSAADKDPPHQHAALIVARKNSSVTMFSALPCSVTILCGDVDHAVPIALAAQLRATNLTLKVSFSTLGDDLSSYAHIISTLDMETPTFGHLNRKTLASFQQTLGSIEAQSFLWLMPAAQEGCRNPNAAASLGVVRTARLELGLPIVTVELLQNELPVYALVASVWDKIARRQSRNQPYPDVEYIIDKDIVKIGRYQPFSLKHELAIKRSVRQSGHAVVALEMEQPGLLDSVRWVRNVPPTRPLGANEIEVEVVAVGINFHDLAMAMGIITEGTGEIHLGAEFSGVVLEVGSSIRTVRSGSRVFGMSSGGIFASSVRVPESLIAEIPDQLSFEDAATMGNFSTGILPLVTIGRMRAGQSILIHSATGGVGQTALQLCSALGITTENIYATVGNATKTQYLIDAYGVRPNHIFTSRNTNFKEDLMDMTNGVGVDLVLNSLSGELLHASWECVSEFGTLVELSRRDLADFGMISLRPFIANRTYSCVNMQHLIEKAPDRVSELLASTLDLYQQGKITPIRPIKIFEAKDVSIALRRLQHPDHMGKVVVKLPKDVSSIPQSPLAPPLQFDPSGSYLLVGGLGGLGRVIAKWMAENGAKELVTLSRSAWADSKHKDTVDDLESLGCSVHVVKGTVQDRRDVEKMLHIATKPCRGIIHLAMVLRNAPLLDMTFEDWEEVRGPKVQGALNLHDVFRDAHLDFFVLASSLITVDEMPGQSNYCAANTWLEGFCHYRRSLGLPASVLSISAIEGAGFVSEHADAERNMRARGTLFLSTAALLDYLELTILCSDPNPLSSRESRYTSR